MAAHIGRAAQEWAHGLGKSLVQLYLDFVAAFANVERALLFMEDRSDESVASCMARFGLPTACMDEFRSLIQAGDGISLMEVGMHMRQVLRQTCQATWMTVQGVEDVRATTKGTEPGDPLGDLLFTLVAARFLNMASEMIENDGLAALIPSTTGDGPFPPCRAGQDSGTH